MFRCAEIVQTLVQKFNSHIEIYSKNVHFITKLVEIIINVLKNLK